ncbi:hypothetical protein FRC11_004166, partial [Ceratobasidium sp. 423]
ELIAPVRRQHGTSPMTLMQGTTRCNELKAGSPHPSTAAPTGVLSMQNLIILMWNQYWVLVDAGLLSNMGGPKPPASSQPRLLLHQLATNLDSQPNHQVLMLSPTPFQVGGGWSQDVVGSQPSGPSKKRPSAASGLSDGSGKRQCMEIVVDNTETETESDDTATESETDTDDNRVPPQAALLPMHDAMPATILDSQLSTASSHSLGGSIPPPCNPASREPLLQDDTLIPQTPNPTILVCVPIPAHLHCTLLQCFLDQVDHATEAAKEAQAQAPNTNNQPSDRDQAADVDEDPATRPQAHPLLGARSNAVGWHMGGPHQLDPVSAACADMVAFNWAVAQGEATSLAEGVKWQSQRMARCAPPASHPLDELLDDDEETLAQAEAYVKGKWPHHSHVCKPKPLAWDVSGFERQVLIMAKVHLFAFALVEGIYQTRATFLRWASAVHHATWQMDLPGRPYIQPDNNIFEILVNNITTLQGKAKERLREFVARVSGFNQNLLKQEEILKNLARFNELYPNSFHCKWQFCIEEWSNGWHQNGDLGMGVMHEKYEAQLAGLKALHNTAPRQMSRLQNHWWDYAVQYSGTVFDPEEVNDVEPTCWYSMHPNTPEPNNAISVKEMDARMLKTACQNSLCLHMEEITVQELAQLTNIDKGDLEGSQAPTSHSLSPPLDDRNEHGVLTTHAKGKGHAN